MNFKTEWIKFTNKIRLIKISESSSDNRLIESFGRDQQIEFSESINTNCTTEFSKSYTDNQSIEIFWMS